MIHSQSYDIIEISKTWWDGLHSWCAEMDSHRLFRRGREGRKNREVVQYLREELDCVGLETDDDR